MPKKKSKPPKDLSKKQLDKFHKDLNKFESTFYLSLVGSDRFEIIPTITESGKALTKEQYALVSKECSRLGLKAIYEIHRDNAIILVNPENKKIGYLSEGIIH